MDSYLPHSNIEVLMVNMIHANKTVGRDGFRTSTFVVIKINMYACPYVHTYVRIFMFALRNIYANTKPNIGNYANMYVKIHTYINIITSVHICLYLCWYRLLLLILLASSPSP